MKELKSVSQNIMIRQRNSISHALGEESDPLKSKTMNNNGNMKIEDDDFHTSGIYSNNSEDNESVKSDEKSDSKDKSSSKYTDINSSFLTSFGKIKVNDNRR